MPITEWSVLPWIFFGWIAYLIGAALAVGLLYTLITAIISHTPLGYNIHRQTLLRYHAYVYGLCVNTTIFALFYWYIAIPLSFLFSLVFFNSALALQKIALQEEKNGMWGLCKPLRIIRGELFSDMSPDQQIEAKKTVEKAYRPLNPYIYFTLTVAVPFAIVVFMYLCGANYLFAPVKLV